MGYKSVKRTVVDMNQEELIKQTIESYLSGGNTLQDMNLKTANALIARVQERAKEMGIPVVAAVSDKAGRPVAVQCMDGAYIGSYDVALNKTYTCVAFKMSTSPQRHLGSWRSRASPCTGFSLPMKERS